MGRPDAESVTVPVIDAVPCAAAIAGARNAAAMSPTTELRLSKCRLIDLPPDGVMEQPLRPA
jgi:hypothetical protein